MEIEYFNRPTMNKGSESVVKKYPNKKSTGPDGFLDKFYQMFKEDLAIILTKFFPKTEDEGIF